MKRKKLKSGKLLGSYTLVREHAEGGNAKVWIAKDQGDNEVAIKILNNITPENLERFKAEMQVLKNRR